MKFSVLMSIYYKENPEYFDRAMVSIWDEQTVRPNEIVIVEDGPLTDGLYEIIQKWKSKLGDLLKVISLEKNVGLGNALNIGLRQCQYELVARMDSDDISLPTRFEKQLQIFQENSIDVCGSWIGEFDLNETEIYSYRKLPEYPEELVKFAKMRSPMNHPTVMFRKASVERVGSYGSFRFAQDYHLWVRMLMNNAVFYNIQEPLVYMRAGIAQLQRRGGIKYAKNEYRLMKEFKKMGFLSNKEFIEGILIRIPIRLMPQKILGLVYKMLR